KTSNMPNTMADKTIKQQIPILNFSKFLYFSTFTFSSHRDILINQRLLQCSNQNNVQSYRPRAMKQYISLFQWRRLFAVLSLLPMLILPAIAFSLYAVL